MGGWALGVCLRALLRAGMAQGLRRPVQVPCSRAPWFWPTLFW